MDTLRYVSLVQFLEQRGASYELEKDLCNLCDRGFALFAASCRTDPEGTVLTSGFYRDPGSSFSMGGCLSAAFSGKKDSKKGGVEAAGNPFSAPSKCIFHMAGI